MERVLIVNADDFGLSKGQNYGIMEACNNGLVTSTTALVNGAAIHHAVELSRSLPTLGVGMHFVLTLGEPLSVMPSLTREGRLGKWVWPMAEQGSLPLDEIAHELDCQYRRFMALFGREPTHIDSHHHIHMLAPIYPIVADFARAKGLPLRLDRKLALAQEGLRSCEAFSSVFYGDGVSEALFLQILDMAIEDDVSSLEVMCHPSFVDSTVMESAYCYPRLTELDILTSASLIHAVKARGFRLENYSSLGNLLLA